MLLLITFGAVLFLDLYRCQQGACDYGHVRAFFNGLPTVCLISLAGGFTVALIIKFRGEKN